MSRNQFALVSVIAVAFLLINLATSSRFPLVWNDEVYYAEPAVNANLGLGFTSYANVAQPHGRFWAGNTPLYSMLLTGWLKAVGIGVVQVRSFGYVIVILAAVALWLATIRLRLITSTGMRHGFYLDGSARVWPRTLLSGRPLRHAEHPAGVARHARCVRAINTFSPDVDPRPRCGVHNDAGFRGDFRSPNWDAVVAVLGRAILPRSRSARNRDGPRRAPSSTPCSNSTVCGRTSLRPYAFSGGRSDNPSTACRKIRASRRSSPPPRSSRWISSGEAISDGGHRSSSD